MINTLNFILALSRQFDINYQLFVINPLPLKGQATIPEQAFIGHQTFLVLLASICSPNVPSRKELYFYIWHMIYMIIHDNNSTIKPRLASHFNTVDKEIIVRDLTLEKNVSCSVPNYISNSDRRRMVQTIRV